MRAMQLAKLAKAIAGGGDPGWSPMWWVRLGRTGVNAAGYNDCANAFGLAFIESRRKPMTVGPGMFAFG